MSFSSTVIEDSLNSLRPVILFDRWKRYKHCEAETNLDKKIQQFIMLMMKLDYLSV